MKGKRPEDCYLVKTDTRKSYRLVSDPVIIGFRLHYRLPNDDHGMHRVTPILWEHEVPNWMAIFEASSATMAASPTRPGGVESILGWAPPKSAIECETVESIWRKRAVRMVETHMCDNELDLKATAAIVHFLQRVPENLRDELWTMMRQMSGHATT